MDEKLAVVNDVIFGNLANFWEAFSFEQLLSIAASSDLGAEALLTQLRAPLASAPPFLND